MTMTVGDLKSFIEDLDDDMPILCAHQPGWPLQETLGAAVRYSESGPLNDREDYDPEFEEGEPNMSGEEEMREQIRRLVGEEADDILYLVLGGHPYNGAPYAPRCVMGEGL